MPYGGAMPGGGGRILFEPGIGAGYIMPIGGLAIEGGGPRIGAGPRIGGIPGAPIPTPRQGPARPGGA